MNDVTGELQDCVTEMLVNHEVVTRNTKFHSTTQRRHQLLRAFERYHPQLLVGFMPTLPVSPLGRSHTIQVELICQMMKIMQDQGKAL
eukprot:12892284-Prorocentrum_lima.AAC.1